MRRIHFIAPTFVRPRRLRRPTPREAPAWGTPSAEAGKPGARHLVRSRRQVHRIRRGHGERLGCRSGCRRGNHRARRWGRQRGQDRYPPASAPAGDRGGCLLHGGAGGGSCGGDCGATGSAVRRRRQVVVRLVQPSELVRSGDRSRGRRRCVDRTLGRNGVGDPRGSEPRRPGSGFGRKGCGRWVGNAHSRRDLCW